MLRNALITSISVLVLLVSCKKDDDDNSQPTPSSPDYYMNVNYQGNSYRMDSDILQYGHSGFLSFGGFVPEIGIASGNAGNIEIWFQDSVKNLDLDNELVGKKIYFNDNFGPFPYASVSYILESSVIYSQRPADSSFYLLITELEYLGTDSFWGSDDVGIYAVKGNFRANMDDGNLGGYTVSTGDFYMQCSMALK